MDRWRRAAVASAEQVAVRPDLWPPGALAWVASAGWIPFVIAVARPPSDAELTHLGADLVASGAWPWNVVLLGSAAVIVIVAGFALTAIGNAVLMAEAGGPPATASGVARLLGVALVAAVPATVIGMVLLLAIAIVAPGAFNAPQEEPGAVVRVIARVAPLGVALVVAIAIGAAFAAVAARGHGIRTGPWLLGRLGAAGWIHVAVGLLVAVAYLVFAGLLLGVLWAPIGASLGEGRIDVAAGLLLVGFVAIWLCLVMAGGALHAWSATTWSRLLSDGRRPAHSGEDLTPA
jgi:hypothetical protein